jgi:Zn-dependent alcohol dehydrogenase
MSFPSLLASYVRTANGDAELASPSNGLSINQRKLLQWCDGKTSVSEMAERLAAGHTVDAGKVARDFERLEALGLVHASEQGGATRAAPAQMSKATSQQSKLPIVGLGGVAIAVLAGAYVLMGGGKQALAPEAKKLATASSAPAPVEQDAGAAAGETGVMPRTRLAGSRRRRRNLPSPRWLNRSQQGMR